ncbi:MAG: cupin domain-containing protein [Arhodomonas sp.]|nr:cupin domain-containing protein [Arhodomonas sp.]
MVVIRGRGEVILGDRVEPLGLHDVVYIAPHTLHQFQATGEEPLGFLCIVDRERDRPVLPGTTSSPNWRPPPRFIGACARRGLPAAEHFRPPGILPAGRHSRARPAPTSRSAARVGACLQANSLSPLRRSRAGSAPTGPPAKAATARSAGRRSAAVGNARIYALDTTDLRAHHQEAATPRVPHTTMTARGAPLVTRCATLPRIMPSLLWVPWVPMTMRSTFDARWRTR